jgi:arsenate reductase-like glutaredoxin family protein
VEFCERDLLADPPGLAELRRLAKMAGVGVRDLVNTKSQAYRKIKPDLDNLDEKGLADLIQKNPRIMVRPLLVKKTKIERGFSEAKYQALLGS